MLSFLGIGSRGHSGIVHPHDDETSAINQRIRSGIGKFKLVLDCVAIFNRTEVKIDLLEMDTANSGTSLRDTFES